MLLEETSKLFPLVKRDTNFTRKKLYSLERGSLFPKFHFLESRLPAVYEGAKPSNKKYTVQTS